MQRSFGDEVHWAGHHYPVSHINIPTWSPPPRCWQEAGMLAVRILHLTEERDGCAIACQKSTKYHCQSQKHLSFKLFHPDPPLYWLFPEE